MDGIDEEHPAMIAEESPFDNQHCREFQDIAVRHIAARSRNRSEVRIRSTAPIMLAL
jgi:hypothetical protein